MVKIAYIEDNANLRDFIGSSIADDRELELVAACETLEEFIEKAPLIDKPDIILQDISLPGMDGLEGIRHLKKLFPASEIIMFTIHDDSERIFKAFCAGATGYLLKSTSWPKIKEGIIQVYRGEAVMTPSIARKVITYFKPHRDEEEGLSPRELQIVQGMVDGLSYKMIADKLLVSVNTVCFHVKNIYRKLQVNSKAEVISKMLKK